MTRHARRAVLALAVLAAAVGTHREARASDPLSRKLCSLGCQSGYADCTYSNGEGSYCSGYLVGCMLGCSVLAE